MIIFELLFKSAVDSFLQVGVFVSIVLFAFGFINYKYDNIFLRFLINNKKLQPLIGALLGLSPGCGGAILVMPLFVKGHISFGTVIATLIATMGDSAFVLISHSLLDFFKVSAISFLVALVVGYLCDYFNLSKRLNLTHTPKDENINKNLDLKDPNIGSIPYKLTHGFLYKLFIILSIIGFIMGVTLLTGIELKNPLINSIFNLVGFLGTILSIIYMFIDKKLLINDTEELEVHKSSSLKETLIHNVSETAFVISLVFVAYFLYELVVYFIGGEDVLTNYLTYSGLISVFGGALIGLIPGCGPQIIFVTLYTKGIIPFGALISNAISQDGDALFPLIAMDKKSAFLATVITTIPAIIIGLAFYLL